MAISDFQLSIIAIGAAGVAGVFAYNKWQERKYRKQAERAFRSDHPDVLLESKTEPVIAGTGGATESDDRVEPVLAAVAPAPQPVEPVADEAAPAIEPTAPLAHPAADCVLRLEAAEPVAANQIWQASAEFLQGVEKPLRYLAWHDGRKAWQQIQAHSALSARQWRIALQLADRRGALTQVEIDAFLRGVQQLADRLLAVVEFPDRARILSRAQELDAFCAGVDVQIGIHVVSNDAAGFPGTKLRGIAEATGMQLEDDGLFHARDDTGQDLYTLGNLEPALFAADEMAGFATHGLTLNLDVPCVTNGGAAFGAMVTSARQLAAGLDGTLVDDNRQPLTQKALDLIRSKIVEFQELMSQHGIAAGTATALRLFS